MSAAAAPVSRAAMLRQSRKVLRRPQSRNASTASKASEGLSKVTASASSTASSAASSASSALGRIGGRTGRMIKFVESMIPPTIYYSRVGLELGKLMVQGQKMAPPSTAHIQTYFTPVMNAVRNPSSIFSAMKSVGGATPEGAMNSVRSVSGEQVGAYAIAGAQILGFFTLGTMIGRLKVIGYHGEVHHEH